MVDIQDDGFINLAINRCHGVKSESVSVFTDSTTLTSMCSCTGGLFRFSPVKRSNSIHHICNQATKMLSSRMSVVVIRIYIEKK